MQERAIDDAQQNLDDEGVPGLFFPAGSCRELRADEVVRSGAPGTSRAAPSLAYFCSFLSAEQEEMEDLKQRSATAMAEMETEAAKAEV